MRPIIVTADATGATTPVVLDQYQNPFNVSYTATGSGTVQVTLSDPFPNNFENLGSPTPTFTWVTAPTTAPNATGFLGQPFRAIRLSGGAQGDTLTVVQSGVKG
jgi:hypothetical protein